MSLYIFLLFTKMKWYTATVLACYYYAMGAYFKLKPFYAIEYYLPKTLNPNVLKKRYDGPYSSYDDLVEEEIEKRNSIYYENLHAKIFE